MRSLITLIFTLVFFTSFSQSTDYLDGWKELNAGNFQGAKSSFEKALKSNSDREKAQIMLCYLHSSVEENKEGNAYFKDLINESPDALNYVRPLWKLTGVFGDSKKIGDYAEKSLNVISSKPNIVSKLKGLIADDQISISRQNNIIEDTHKPFYLIQDWALAGPFYNHMNAGFNKDYGVLKGVNDASTFDSKNGAKVSWFKVQNALLGGYLYYSQYFNETNALMYAQTFVEAKEDQEVLIKFGYGGILKLWVNDTEIYANQSYRETYFDYYAIKLKLKKGWNRILVENGKHDGNIDAFSVGFTDTAGTPLNLNISNNTQTYPKDKFEFSLQEDIISENLKKLGKQYPNEPIYKFLLAEDYLVVKDFDAAEAIINEELTANPKNYVWLREMIVLQNKKENTTLSSKYFETYKELYPDDYDVIVARISDYIQKSNKSETTQTIEKFVKLYPSNEYVNEIYKGVTLSLNGKFQEAIDIYEDLSSKYYNKKEFVGIYVKLLKDLKNPPAKILKFYKKSLAAKFDFEINSMLIEEYEQMGDTENAIKLIEKCKSFLNFYTYDRQIANLYTKQKNYQKSIDIHENILKFRPTDYTLYSELASLYLNKGDEKKAIYYKELALKFSPYSFKLNQDLRELKKLSIPYDLVKPFDTEKAINDYEKNKNINTEKEIDYVIDNKQQILFKSNATAQRITYMVKINQESALTNWQETTIYSTENSDTEVMDVKTIKKNGTKIDADSEDGRYVFKNLEVGDYIFIDFVTKQTMGNRTASFIEDSYLFNALYPCYKSEYSLYYEDGVVFKDTVLNGKINTEIIKKDGFTLKKWTEVNSEIVKDENNSTPLNESAKMLYISTIKSWEDVSTWYADLSNFQALADPVVKKVYDELFANKTYTEEEKAKVIYEYIAKNITYSSIDFRQSNHIPQKASDVIQTKIGDCKDISTLFASLGRMAGLDIDLVLVSTSDRGLNYFHYPSINFNHCIVKLNLKSGVKYLELTNNYLPYGYLPSTLKFAQILDIPFQKSHANNEIKTLDYNKNYINSIIRKVSVNVKPDLKLEINETDKKVGNEASISYQTYLSLSEKDRKEKLKEFLANAYKSKVAIKDVDFGKLVSRNDTARLQYSFVVDNEVLKVGSLRSLKIPFSDMLAQNALFGEEENRTRNLNFNTYEPTDKYVEEINFTLSDNFKFEETPKNVNLTWGKFSYSLGFKAIDNKRLQVLRTYIIDRKNISPKEYNEFRTFMQTIIEAENTNIVFK